MVNLMIYILKQKLIIKMPSSIEIFYYLTVISPNLLMKLIKMIKKF